ncbi:MAG TPA: hypothetical protein VGD31_14075, partial [Sphingobacteriaceae bacterium]
FEAVAAQQGKDLREVVRDQFQIAGGLKQDKSASFSREPNWMFDYFNAASHGLKPNQVQQATNRAKKIESIINAIQDDGKITPAAQAAVGALKNTKYGDGDVIDVKLVPGNNTPGTIEPFEGSVITNDPNPRLVLKVKYSDRGLPKTEQVILSDEGAFETLNGLFESSPSEGKQSFSTDQLTSLMKYDLSKLYRGQRGVAEQNEADKATENKVVAEWQKGESLETLSGRYFEGKKILSAKRTKVDPGIFGLGKKHVIELEFDGPNGKEYKDIDEKDYESLAKIYRGEGVRTSSDNMVSVIAPNGKKGRIPAENLDAALKAGYKKAND